jgi:cytochrome c-type biogenesis protein CcmF
VLEPGQSITLGRYEFVYAGLTDRSSDAVSIQEARVEVLKDGKPLGALTPQSRVYGSAGAKKHPHSEVSTLGGLGDEVYATIHDVDGQKVSPLKVSVHPLVNWIWIGGALLCTVPFLALRRFSPATTGPR